MKLPRCLNLLIIFLLGYFLLQTYIVVLQLYNIYYVLGLNILFSGIVLALLYMSWKKVFAPLRELADKIDKMKDEQLYPVEENSDFSYEALSLIKAFNRLILSINSSNEELKEKNREMEELNSEFASQHKELEDNLQELQRIKHNNEMFAELGMVMSESRLELEEIGQNAIEFASLKLGFPLIALYTKDKSSTYNLLASRGIKEAVESFSAGESIMGAAVLDKKPIYISRPEYGGVKTETINGEEILPYQGYIPLLHREECQGLMVLASWQEMDRNLIEYMSRRVAVNLYNAYLHVNLLHTYEQLHEEATLVEELSAQREEDNEHARRDRNIAMALLESVEEALFFHLQDGRIYVHNQHFAKMTGEQTLANGWDTSLNVEDVMKAIISTMENPEKLFETVNELKKDPDQTISLNIVQQEPFFAAYEVFTAPVHDIVEGQDKILGRIWTFRDISREYEINAMKNEFVSTVSHELRTPLSSIMGFTELMLSRQLDSQKQKKYLETIEREARRLTDLINDFLDIQRMESGRVSYEISNFDLFEICEELAEVFQTKSDKHQILVTGSPPIIVKADLSKIKQVLNNLISNAVKYSPAGGEVEIELSQEKETVYLSIKDQGLGIPEKSMPHIFERFFRVDNSDRRNIGGTGLGLAIVKELLDNMQGRVWAETKLGEGSIFHVRLPRGKDNKAISSVINQEAEKTVLIAEDDPAMLELLVEKLKEYEFRIVYTSRGAEVLPKVKEYSPEVIVLDLTLEDEVSGWQVLEDLKNNKELSRLPVVISSGQEMPREKEKEREKIAAYFVKPYNLSALGQRIAELMKSNESRLLVTARDEETFKQALLRLKEDGFDVEENIMAMRQDHMDKIKEENKNE